MNIGKISLCPAFKASANYQPAQPIKPVEANLERQPETDEFTKEVTDIIKRSKSEGLTKLEKEKLQKMIEFKIALHRPQKYQKEEIK